jgi:hypothetical protein
VGKQTVLKSPQSQIRKYWRSVRVSQIRKFLHKTLCLKTVLKVVLKIFVILCRFELEHTVCVRRNLRTRGSFKSAKKRLSLHITNPQIKKSTDHEERLGTHFAKPGSATFGEDPQNKKIPISEHLWTCGFQSLFADRPLSGSFIGSSSFILILIGPRSS